MSNHIMLIHQSLQSCAIMVVKLMDILVIMTTMRQRGCLSVRPPILTMVTTSLYGMCQVTLVKTIAIQAHGCTWMYKGFRRR